jgi:integrase
LERCSRRLEDLAGLSADRHLGPHALRATHATMVWLRNGAVARQSLGHTRLETTIGHYIANTAMAETLESLF